MYDATGHVIVVLMRPGRATFASGDPLAATPEEIREAFLGFDTYCGTYSIDHMQYTIAHLLFEPVYLNLHASSLQR